MTHEHEVEMTLTALFLVSSGREGAGFGFFMLQGTLPLGYVRWGDHWTVGNMVVNR